ncbi:hypothetical protein AAVH_14804 [Aphelenchoides avenae]|nr:hypothetical protein AAVH_14804 [Aphelenchus avenae]
MPACNATYCAAAVWIGLYRNCPISHEFKWVDRGKFDYKSWGPLRPFPLIFLQHTYVSLYSDEMVKPAGFFGKWDHYKQNSITNVRAGVCKRDY